MGDLFKIGWDLVVLRHYNRQGMKLSAGDYVVAIGFVIFLYGTGVPAAVLYQNHPQYKWVLIATLVIDGIATIAMFVYEIKWWIKHRAAVLAANSAQPSAPPNQPGQ
jgi:divalent metal cation (Fe/Co/Zn/Cd) transporter